MIYFIQLLLITLLNLNNTLAQVPPTWVTSNYIQAASKKVIDGDACQCMTSNSTTPSATVPFPTSFSTVPNLGYGISSYQGNDFLAPEQFQVNRTSLTTSSFSVLIQIVGFTNIWVVEVRFIAISKSFPHHLNSFDNVPVNYMNKLTNITKRNGMNLRQYQNIINYTSQAASIGSNYRYFSLPLSNNKVLVFLTTLYVNCPGTYTTSRVDMHVTAEPLSIDTYRLLVKVDHTEQIYKLHFSIVTFDQNQVQASGKYLLVYNRIQFTNAGGSYNFPAEFLNNFMIGMVEFSSSIWQQIIHFMINYLVVGGKHRLQMPTAITRRPGAAPVVRYNFNIFYLKTWVCPPNTIFDPATDMCVTCPVNNCITCFNMTTCASCNQSNGYFLNQTSKLCSPCSIAGCSTCTNLTICADCNQTLGYVLNSPACQLCQASMNYFPDVLSQTCILCNINFCINCSSLTECRQCNILQSYYANINGTCQFCDPAVNKFIDPVTKSCVLCPVAFCTTCASYFTCQVCSIGYLINLTDNLCYICTQVGCDYCLTLTTCSLCSVGYYLDGSSQCQPCSITGCLNCTSASICVQCDEMNRYLLSSSSCLQCPPNQFPNIITSTCESCSLPQCQTCLTLSICSSCNSMNFYYLMPSGICAYCDPATDKFINSNLTCQTCSLPYCTDCSSLTVCTQCNNLQNYFLNLTDNLCHPCSLANCQICLDLTICSICNIGFFLDPTSTSCQPCTMLGCLNCSDLLTCVECDFNNNYILNVNNSTCQICPTGSFANSTSQNCQNCTIIGCSICSSLSSCLTCEISNSYYPLQSGACGYCNASSNNFINPATFDCELCSIPYCIQCSSLITCSVCNITAMQLINSTDNLCYPCTISNCILCSTFTSCSICNSEIQYFVNNTNGQCQLCKLPNCLKCSSLTSCSLCDIDNNYGLDFTSPNSSLCGPCNVSCICDGYGLPWNHLNQECTSICGDGLLRGNEECDDGNIDSSDGCSAVCKVQRFYTCINEPSFCYSYFYIVGQFISVEKAGCNIFKATFFTPGLHFNEIGNNIYIHYPQGLNIIDRRQNNQYIDIYVEYTRDLINQTILVDFRPGDRINFTYNPKTPATHYSENQCKGSQITKNILTVTQILSYIILVASLLSCKIVGLQLFGLLQLSFFTLSSHDFLNIYLAPIVQFKTFNGLNVNFLTESSMLPAGIMEINLSGTFLNNINIMLVLLFGGLIIGLGIYIVGKISNKKKVKKVGLQLLKQGFITLVLFNSFNIAFSAGTHFRFANPNDPGYIFSTVVLAITIFSLILSVFAMQITQEGEYGQFKKKFKDNFVCKLYIPFTVCYRMVLGFYIAYQNTYEFNPLIAIGFSLTFFMYFIVNLPFQNFYQNYRAGLIHLGMLFTLLTTNYYKNMKSTTPIELKSKMHTLAIIEIVLIVLSLFVSFLVLVYEIYSFFSSRRREKLSPTNLIGQTTNQNVFTS